MKIMMVQGFGLKFKKNNSRHNHIHYVFQNFQGQISIFVQKNDDGHFLKLCIGRGRGGTGHQYS